MPLSPAAFNASTSEASASRSRTTRAIALVAAVCAVALVLAGRTSANARTTSPAGPRASTASYQTQVAQAVLQQLNNYRAAYHRPALTMNPQLLVSAHRHNLAMASYNVMSHQEPNEAYFSNRITAAGYKWRAVGENIGYTAVNTTASVVQLEVLMQNEKPPYDGHRQNILNQQFQNVGIDVYVDQKNGKVWLTCDFGRHF